MLKVDNFDNKLQSVNENEKNEVGKATSKNKMTEKEIKEYIGFTKFKNRLFMARLLKSLLATLAFAFIACGVMLIITKREVWDISPWFSLLFGFIAGIITFPCVFLPLSFTDKGLAFKLDEEFSLKEKMHTSLANLDNDSPMSILLRQDLNETTEKIAAKKVKLRGLPVYIAVAVIGLATLITGLAIKKLEAPPPPPPQPPADTVWNISEEQIVAIESIIDTVEKSDMVSPAKDELVQSMKDLLKSLKEENNYENARNLVADCVAQMDEITYKTGSSLALHDAIKAKDTVFARELARALTKADNEKYMAKLLDALNSLKHANDALEEPTEDEQAAMKRDTLYLLSFTALDILDALEKSGVDSSDRLYGLVSELISLDKNGNMGIGTLAEKGEIYSHYTYRYIIIKVDSISETVLANNIYKEILAQNKNYSIGYDASNGLRELFEITPLASIEDTSEESKKDDDDTEIEEDEDKNAAGGYGPGVILGTDELIYDRESGQSIITLEIYQKYEKIMKDHFASKDENSEGVPDEMSKYFELLLKGYKEGEKENG